EPDWLDEPGLLWFRELFANVGLHGYVAEREPECLPVLETLFEVVGGMPPGRGPLRRLGEVAQGLAGPGPDGTTYVWFEFRLQLSAKRLWEAAGAAGFRALHQAVQGPALGQDALLELLASMDPGVAADLRRWSTEPD